MHEAALARAALPALVVIQRTPLLPYSLGHELFLTREGNAFISGGTPTRKDLLEAVWICCNSFEENKNSPNSWLAPRKAKIIAKRFEGCDLGQCIQSFHEYLADGSLQFPLSEIPRTTKETNSVRFPGAPFILRLHQFLISHLRLSEVQAWDYPVGLAKMRWATHWEQEGGLDIYGPQDESLDRFQNDPKTIEMIEELRKKGRKCQA